MRERTTDDLPAYPPVLDPALLTRIHALNRDYIELIVAEYIGARGATSPLHLPRTVMDALALLGDEQRTALACTSYSLYSLGFENATFWCAAADNVTTLPAQSRYGVGKAQAENAFCEVALFCAWHSALANPVAARVLYGVSDAVLKSLSATPMWLVKRIAAEHPRLLLPRWPANPRFWPDLVRFAALEDSRRLAAAQLLGNQLLAVELERAQRRAEPRK